MDEIEQLERVSSILNEALDYTNKKLIVKILNKKMRGQNENKRAN